MSKNFGMLKWKSFAFYYQGLIAGVGSNPPSFLPFTVHWEFSCHGEKMGWGRWQEGGEDPTTEKENDSLSQLNQTGCLLFFGIEYALSGFDCQILRSAALSAAELRSLCRTRLRDGKIRQECRAAFITPDHLILSWLHSTATSTLWSHSMDHFCRKRSNNALITHHLNSSTHFMLWKEKKCNFFLCHKVSLCCVPLACSLLPKDQPRAWQTTYDLKICLHQNKAIDTKVVLLAVDFPCFPCTFILVKMEIPQTEKSYGEAK